MLARGMAKKVELCLLVRSAQYAINGSESEKYEHYSFARKLSHVILLMKSKLLKSRAQLSNEPVMDKVKSVSYRVGWVENRQQEI